MKAIKLKHCIEADIEHLIAKRQYAHTGHREAVVCVARAYWNLPQRFRLGILFHELAHLCGVEGEKAADRAAKRLFGVEIRRESSRFGDHLESI